MPRQPYLPTYSHATFTIGPRTLDERPELAALVGRCIALWTEVELQMALILAAVLKANTAGAVAVFLALKNVRTRRDVLEAAAKATLSGEALKIFGAFLTYHRSVETQRNDLAHGIFGVAEAIPDAILWTTTSDDVALLLDVSETTRRSLC